MTTTNTLVAMEEEDDFDDPMTPTPVKGLFNDIKVAYNSSWLYNAMHPEYFCLCSSQCLNNVIVAGIFRVIIINLIGVLFCSITKSKGLLYSAQLQQCISRRLVSQTGKEVSYLSKHFYCSYL